MATRITTAEVQIQETDIADAILLPADVGAPTEEKNLLIEPTYEGVVNILQGATHLTEFQVRRISQLNFFTKRRALAVSGDTQMVLSESKNPTGNTALIDPRPISITDCEEADFSDFDMRFARRLFEASESQTLFVARHAPDRFVRSDIHHSLGNLIIVNTADLA